MTELIDYCNCNQGFVMAVLTAVYVVATIALVFLGYLNVRNLWKLEQERLRPYVYCEFFFVDILMNFAIKNGGMTLAKNVKIEFSPPLYHLRSPSYNADYKKEEIAFFANAIASLSPGQKLDQLIGYYSHFEKEYPSLKITGTVSYESIFGTHYKDVVVLDISYEKSRVSIKRKTIEQVANSLEKIERIVNHIATGFHKPHVIVQDIEHKKKETKEFFDNQTKEKTN